MNIVASKMWQAKQMSRHAETEYCILNTEYLERWWSIFPSAGIAISTCCWRICLRMFEKLQKVGKITSTCCKKIFHKVVKCWKCDLNLALVCHQLVAGRWRGGEGHLTLDCSQSLFYFDKSAHPCLTFHRFLFLLFHNWICPKDLLHQIDMVPGKSTMTCQSQRTCATFTSFARHKTNTGHWSAIDWSAVSDNAAPLAVVFAGWERYRSQSEKKVKVRFKCFCPSDLACSMDNDE